MSPSSSTEVPRPAVTQADLHAALSGLRERRPLVQCLTNVVAAGLTANVLLAVGASPAMVDNPEEAGSFVAADAVLVNLGTPQEEKVTAIGHAVTAAERAGIPWVLDPVGVGPLAWRTRVAMDLLVRSTPSIIRGNASEILALTGGRGGRGTDSVAAPEAALPAARELAEELSTIVAVSGAVDHLTDGVRLVCVANGSELLTKVSGAGCALGALMAAFAGVLDDALLAATAATATLTVAAEVAADRSRGPGSFAVALLDELASLSPTALAERVRLDRSPA